MSIYEELGVRTIINAKGPSTRLSGGFLDDEVARSMVEASQHCVDIAELQAAASRVIGEITGSEAGYVTAGAAAGLLLGTAACVTGLDPGKMNQLPDTTGMKGEIVMVRSQRNFYDHAVRGAGVRIVEVGLPDRFAGVRDAEGWRSIRPSASGRPHVLRGVGRRATAARGGRQDRPCPGRPPCPRCGRVAPADNLGSWRSAPSRRVQWWQGHRRTKALGFWPGGED